MLPCDPLRYELALNKATRDEIVLAQLVDRMFESLIHVFPVELRQVPSRWLPITVSRIGLVVEVLHQSRLAPLLSDPRVKDVVKDLQQPGPNSFFTQLERAFRLERAKVSLLNQVGRLIGLASQDKRHPVDRVGLRHRQLAKGLTIQLGGSWGGAHLRSETRSDGKLFISSNSARAIWC